LRSEAGNVEAAVVAAGFTTLFILFLFALVAVLALRRGWVVNRARRSMQRAEPQVGQPPLRGGRSVPGGQPIQGGQPQPIRGERLKGKKFGVSWRRNKAIVEVNPNKCARFGFCEHEAPGVFYLESDGRFGYQGSVPVEKLEQVVQAMDVCPRRAISVKVPRRFAASAAQARAEPGGPWRTLPTLVPGTAEPREGLPRRPQREPAGAHPRAVTAGKTARPDAVVPDVPCEWGLPRQSVVDRLVDGRPEVQADLRLDRRAPVALGHQDDDQVLPRVAEPGRAHPAIPAVPTHGRQLVPPGLDGHPKTPAMAVEVPGNPGGGRLLLRSQLIGGHQLNRRPGQDPLTQIPALAQHHLTEGQIVIDS
jgi:ferredoxin